MDLAAIRSGVRRVLKEFFENSVVSIRKRRMRHHEFPIRKGEISRPRISASPHFPCHLPPRLRVALYPHSPRSLHFAVSIAASIATSIAASIAVWQKNSGCDILLLEIKALTAEAQRTRSKKIRTRINKRRAQPSEGKSETARQAMDFSFFVSIL